MTTGTMKGWVLGMKLTELRHRSGLSTRDAATKVGVSSASLNRAEKGKRVPDRAELGAMLAAYQGTEADWLWMHRWLSSADTSDGWWASTPDAQRNHREAVSVLRGWAMSVTAYAPTILPDLLQIPSYSDAIGTPTPDALELARQHRQLADGAGPRYTAVLDEGVLRRTVGGALTTTRQLRHLLELVHHGRVRVHVIPFHRHARPVTGAFTLYALADGRAVVHVDNHTVSGLIDNRLLVKQYRTTGRELIDSAFDRAESADLLRRIAQDHERAATA